MIQVPLLLLPAGSACKAVEPGRGHCSQWMVSGPTFGPQHSLVQHPMTVTVWLHVLLSPHASVTSQACVMACTGQAPLVTGVSGVMTTLPKAPPAPSPLVQHVV